MCFVKVIRIYVYVFIVCISIINFEFWALPLKIHEGMVLCIENTRGFNYSKLIDDFEELDEKKRNDFFQHTLNSADYFLSYSIISIFNNNTIACMGWNDHNGIAFIDYRMIPGSVEGRSPPESRLLV